MTDAGPPMSVPDDEYYPKSRGRTRRRHASRRQRLLDAYGPLCYICEREFPPDELTIEHLVPVSRGGSEGSWDNQMLACRPCNAQKMNYTLEEYRRVQAGEKVQIPPSNRRNYAPRFTPRLKYSLREIMSDLNCPFVPREDVK